MDHGQHRSGVSLTSLIKVAQASDADDSWAMNQIVRRFAPLARRLARSTDVSRSLRDDLENAAYVALVVAVRRHDGRSGFPAFAEIYMRGAVWREYHRLLPPKVSADMPVADASAPTAGDFEKEALDRLAPWGGGELAKVISRLSLRQKGLVNRRYVEDAPLEQIASEDGTSKSAVSQRLATIHRSVATALAA